MKKTLAFVLSVAMVLTMGILIPFGSAVSAGEVTYGAQNAGQVDESYEHDPNATGVGSWNELTSLIGEDSSGNYFLSASFEAPSLSGLPALAGFSGTLDGCGFTITLDAPLFKTLNGATIKNLNIVSAFEVNSSTGASVTGPDAAAFTSGALAQRAVSGTNTITNVKVDVDITAPSTVSAHNLASGFIGSCATGVTLLFTNCETTGSILNNASGSNCMTSGFVIAEGSASGTWNFDYCTNGATVTGNSKSGGFVGDSRSFKITMDHCLNSGAMNGVTNSGGFIGYIGGGGSLTATYCKNTGKISQTTTGKTSLGGFVGKPDGETNFSNCVNAGEISANITGATGAGEDNEDAAYGGIIGSQRTDKLNCTIDTCRNEAAVTAPGYWAGGIIGSFRSTGGSGKGILTITNSTNTGAVTAAGQGAGGILGRSFVKNKKADATSVTAANCIVINKCTNTGNVTAAKFTGGIVGYIMHGIKDVSITDCVNSGNVTSKTGGGVGGVLGGLVCNVFGNIMVDGCSNTGAITAESENDNNGGIIGYLNPTAKKADLVITVKDCTNEGDVKGGSEKNGGIVGHINPSIPSDTANACGVLIDGCENSGEINTTTVKTSGGSAGGIVGVVKNTGDFTVNDCHNTGTIVASTRASGIVAYITGNGASAGMYGDITISGCTNEGKISATGSDNVGGILGYTDTELKKDGVAFTIEECTNSGNISGKGGKSGGIIGYFNFKNSMPNGTLTVKDCVNEGAISDATRFAAGICGQFITPASASSTTFNINFTNCDNSGTIYHNNTSQDARSAGIIGHINTACTGTITVDGCDNTGSVTSTSATAKIAGIVGNRDNTATNLVIKNCTNAGKLTAPAGARIDGIASSSLAKLQMTNSYCIHVPADTNIGVCDLCTAKLAKFDSAQVSIGSDLTVEYTATIDAVLEPEEVYAVFTRNDVVVQVPGVEKSTGVYTFAYTGVNPQCMGDEIVAELYVNGILAATMGNYSVKQNIENLYANAETNALKALLADVLNFGAAAQLYTGYNTETLVNTAEWVAEYATDATVDDLFEDKSGVTGSSVEGAKLSGRGIFFDNAFHVYYNVEVADVSKAAVSIEDEPAELSLVKKGVYRAISAPVSILEIGKEFAMTFKYDGASIYVANYSVSDYLCRMNGKVSANMQLLLEAVANLYVSASACDK